MFFPNKIRLARYFVCILSTYNYSTPSPCIFKYFGCLYLYRQSRGIKLFMCFDQFIFKAQGYSYRYNIATTKIFPPMNFITIVIHYSKHYSMYIYIAL